MHAGNRLKETRGSAFVIAVVLVAVLGIGGATAYRSIHRALGEHRRFEQTLVLSHLADAGIDMALATLHSDPDNAAREFSLALGDGTVQVVVRPGAVPETYRLTARAELRNGPVIRAAATYTATAHIEQGVPPRLLSWQLEKAQQ